MPKTSELKKADESFKGAGACIRTKPAIMTTGLVVQVPEYLEQGEIIKINTEDGRFMSRA